MSNRQTKICVQFRGMSLRGALRIFDRAPRKTNAKQSLKDCLAPPLAGLAMTKGAKILICCLLVSTIFLDGCEPLRKKFTRKKKKTSVGDETVPILEPIDYPQKVYSPAETYKHHYSLWQVWNNELQSLVLENTYRKRKIYLVDQIIANLEVMKNLIVEEKQTALISSLERLRKVKSDLEAFVPTRNLSALKRELALIDKDIRNGYKFSSVENALKQP